MIRFTTLTISVLLLCLVAVSAQASSIETVFPEGDVVVKYQQSFWKTYDGSSQVSIWVENIEDKTRWKEWRIEIWLLNNPVLPEGLIIQVDYDNTADHSAPLELFPVTLAPCDEPIWDFLPFGFYADTTEDQWEEFGTVPDVPENENLPHNWGNPNWVSFHFVLDGGPWGLHIYDECVPEPATLGLLLLGGLALLRRRR